MKSPRFSDLEKVIFRSNLEQFIDKTFGDTAKEIIRGFNAYGPCLTGDVVKDKKEIEKLDRVDQARIAVWYKTIETGRFPPSCSIHRNVMMPDRTFWRMSFINGGNVPAIV